MAPRLTPAVRIGLSIAVATGLYGISFGALAVASGFSVGQTAALSLLMFTGGSQFAFIGVIGAGGGGPAAFGAATLLGIRNAVYGAQINHLLRPRGWLRPLAAQVTIDESAATAAGQDAPAEQRRGFWVAGVGVYVLWNLCTVLGALHRRCTGRPAPLGAGRRRGGGLPGSAVAAPARARSGGHRRGLRAGHGARAAVGATGRADPAGGRGCRAVGRVRARAGR